MILGDPRKIDLSTSSFEGMRNNNNLYVDKTIFIEHFLNEPNSVQLIVRQRRLGKSMNLDMLRCFLTDDENHKELFEGTYIRNSGLWSQANSAPVFYFDFKNLHRENYKEQIKKQIVKHIYNYVGLERLKDFSKYNFDSFVNGNIENPEGLLILTEIVYEITGKCSYILIDEYDKLLTDNYNNGAYDSIREYESSFLSAGLKGNRYLKKALLTGVMRVSGESMLSGLNNLAIYDVFTDKTYTDDFGLTDAEVDLLRDIYDFNKNTAREWYNGIKVKGVSIYNIYSVISYIRNGELGNYWGRSGAIDIIIGLMNEDRKNALMRMLNGETIEVFLSYRISLHELSENPGDGNYYSLLVQSGYLSLESIDTNNYGYVKIPNIELMNVWKEFVLSSIVNDEIKTKTLFDNISYLNLYDKDVEYFLNNRLSFFDISDTEKKTAERIYHVFVLGLLSAYEDITFKNPPVSNRESGDGRYDIFFERRDYSIIFEFKSVEYASQLVWAAENGLRQIDEKRYYTDAPKDKPLIKTAIAFCGKHCAVKSSLHVW